MTKAEVLDTLGVDAGSKAGAALSVFIEETRADGTLFSPGDVANHLYMLGEEQLATGLVELFVERGDSGRPSVIERVVEGIVGETEFVGRDEAGRAPYRLFGARVLRPTRLYRLPYRALLAMSAEDLAPIDRLLGALTVERCRLLATAGQAARHLDRPVLLAETLLRLAEDTGSKEGTGLRLGVRKTQQELADEVGLSREAVNGHLNEWSRQGWLDLAQPTFVIRDVERLRRIIELSRRPSRAAHDRAIARIDRVLDSGDSFRARNLALDLLRFYPASSELRHRAVLACLRAGAGLEADQLLQTFQFGADAEPGNIASEVRRGLGQLTAGEDTGALDDDEDYGERQRRMEQRLPALIEDVLVLPARRLKDRAFAGGACDPAKAEHAADAYRRVFDFARRPYAAINAAAMYLASGQHERAAILSRQVLDLLPDDRAFWTLTMRAEALAWLGRDDEAKVILREAATVKDATPGAIATTRLQLSRLAMVLGPRLTPLLECLPQRRVLAFSGHMLAAGEAAAGGFADVLAERIGEALDGGAPVIGFGALAAGSDIVFAEEVRRKKGEFHAVLPLRVDDFFSTSVSPHSNDALDWRPRANGSLAGAASLTIAGRDRITSMSRLEIDDAIAVANRRCVGAAMIRADELCTSASLLALWDRQPGNSVAGTAHLVDACHANGVDVQIIDCPWSRPRPRQTAEADRGKSLHAPVVFVWLPERQALRNAERQTLIDQEVRRKAIETVPSAWLGERTMRGGARAILFATKSVGSALDLGAALAAAVEGEAWPLRIVLDFGQILKPDGMVAEDKLTRLEAANDLGGLPTGTLVATESFATEARFSDPASAWRFLRAGRATVNERGMMPAPSTPLYFVEA